MPHGDGREAAAGVCSLLGDDLVAEALSDHAGDRAANGLGLPALLARGLAADADGHILLTDAGYAAVGKRRTVPKGIQKMDTPEALTKREATDALQKLEVTIRPGTKLFMMQFASNSTPGQARPDRLQTLPLKPTLCDPINRLLSTVMAEPWVSVEQVAEHLGVTRDSIYRWIDRKGLPAHRVGRLWKFKISEVDDWVRAGGADNASEKTGASR